MVAQVPDVSVPLVMLQSLGIITDTSCVWITDPGMFLGSILSLNVTMAPVRSGSHLDQHRHNGSMVLNPLMAPGSS